VAKKVLKAKKVTKKRKTVEFECDFDPNPKELKNKHTGSSIDSLIDSLHIPYKDLEIKVNDKVAMILNKSFIDKQNAWDNLELIKKLMEAKLKIYKLIETLPLEDLSDFDVILTNLEYKIQEAYHFEKDQNYHRFWEAPKCKCPKIDNSDSWPSGLYTFNLNCPIHGHRFKGKI